MSEKFTGNQFWDVSSDVKLCFSASSALMRTWIGFGILFTAWLWYNYATIKKVSDSFALSSHGNWNGHIVGGF